MNNWLAGIVGETAAPIVGFVLLFALVIVLLLLVFAILRRVTGGTFVSGGRNRQVRLSVTDAAAVDNRRRLVLVRRDDVEHLILIGGPSDLVIEQNIRQFAKPQSRVEPAATVVPADAEPKAEAKPVEAPRLPPVAPPRVSPPVIPVSRPAPAPAAAPHVPLRPAAPPVQPQAPVRETPQPETQRPVAAAPLPPVPPMQPIPPVVAAAAELAPQVSAPVVHAPAEAPNLDAPQRDNGWQRTAAPSFGSTQRSEPHIDALPRFEETRPEPAAPVETRTTTAAAFPFSVQNLKPAQDESSLDILGPAKPEEPEINLADLDFGDAFESDLEGELHVTPDEAARKEPGNIEDEMERLLGDLSKPEKR